MARWIAFLVLLVVVTGGVVALARSSADFLDSEAGAAVSGRVLRWNVVASQALVAVAVLVAAWIAGVPWEAFGWPEELVASELSRSVNLGLGLGVGIAAGNAVLERLVDARALREAEVLRGRLAPDSPIGWISLLVVVIPTIAIAEELLFRGALVGALAVGFAVSPWVLAGLSSVLFGAAHAAQGPIGVAVTTGFGLVLAGAFVLTGDLLLVIVAHWTVDAIEFVFHEGPNRAR